MQRSVCQAPAGPNTPDQVVSTSALGAQRHGERVRAVLVASPGGTLIHGSDEMETFDSSEDAAAHAVEAFGVASHLIRTGDASSITLPGPVVLQSR